MRGWRSFLTLISANVIRLQPKRHGAAGRVVGVGFRARNDKMSLVYMRLE